MENQPKRWLEKILEAAIVIALSAFLIRLAACYLLQALPVIAIVATLITVGVILYRIWKHKKDSNW